MRGREVKTKSLAGSHVGFNAHFTAGTLSLLRHSPKPTLNSARKYPKRSKSTGLQDHQSRVPLGRSPALLPTETTILYLNGQDYRKRQQGFSYPVSGWVCFSGNYRNVGDSCVEVLRRSRALR